MMLIFSASLDKLNGQRPASRPGYRAVLPDRLFSFSLLSMLSELQIAIMVSIEASMLTQSSGILHDGRLYLKPGPEVQCQIHLLVRAAIITEACSKITGDYKTQS